MNVVFKEKDFFKNHEHKVKVCYCATPDAPSEQPVCFTLRLLVNSA